MEAYYRKVIGSEFPWVVLGNPEVEVKEKFVSEEMVKRIDN